MKHNIFSVKNETISPNGSKSYSWPADFYFKQGGSFYNTQLTEVTKGGSKQKQRHIYILIRIFAWKTCL